MKKVNKIIIIILFLLINLFYLMYSSNIINTKRMTASWYDEKSNTGIYTANGEIFNENAMTCAILDYKFNTLLKITNLENNKWIIIRVNDRINKKYYCRIDLSKAAFQKIADLNKGIIKVKIRKIK